ncbi:NAD-dependent epimerase/dehydratase family protein [Streptomyces sp. NPDC001941]|uniref:NAD-dependent epimerase/dehydratase family protein n=1 Tax=Streptomyces sp. NPDC001941 TaxID=3154659 RepID=UPI003318A659
MKLLVLGGSWFLGKAIVQQALEQDWEVTAFTRGRSGTHVPGVRPVNGDRLNPDDLKRLADHGPWDAVVDTSSSDFAPRDVRLAARSLARAAARWVHVSTVSVYQGWPHEPLNESSPLLDCPPDADESYGYTGADGSPTKYGFQKAGGERAVEEFFPDASVCLRPGVILGPGEYVGRLPWWLNRAALGGRMVAPGPADQRIQPVDVRDVARFALDQAAASGGGAYNITHPGGITFDEFLAACLAATGSTGEPAWAPADVLAAHEVAQWTELPLWRTHEGVWSVDSPRAVAAGLSCRPLHETVADTWAWLQADGRPVEHPRWAEHGLSPAKEQQILDALSG